MLSADNINFDTKATNRHISSPIRKLHLKEYEKNHNIRPTLELMLNEYKALKKCSSKVTTKPKKVVTQKTKPPP